MKKGLAIGTSDFKNLRNQGNYYVDKSLMISELLEDSSSIILFPRPRRFGKTLNMSMLRYFFDVKEATENRRLFEGLMIAQEDLFDLHQGKYPVVFITFKDVKSNKFEDAYTKLARVIGSEFSKHRYLLTTDILDETSKGEFLAIASYKANQNQVEESLFKLSEYLSAYYHQKIVILLDEYDTPIHSAYHSKYYNEMIDFMRSLLGATFKDNINLFKGILTGTLRISRESIFTGFNNSNVYTLLNSEFSTCFGFTPAELKEMLEYYEVTQLEDGIRSWYNGYIFGSSEIYNPWSILKFVSSQDKKFIAHWINTSSNDLIKELIVDSPSVIRTELHDLLTGKTLVKKLNENISFPELKHNDDAIYSFLVFSGYLKARLFEFDESRYWYELSIPNKEVKELFETIIMSWFNESFQQSKSKILVKALLENDIELFEELLGECVLQTLSFYELEKREVERVYQAFILGLLVSLTPQYEVTSNKESGYGRYDICIIPVNNRNKPAIILELKSLRQKETAKKAIASALQQIEDRQYETAIRQRGLESVIKLAVVFDGKRVWVKEASQRKPQKN